jgi:hypothetical protein
VIFLLLAAGGAVSYVMYRDWVEHLRQREAAALIEETQGLVDRLRSLPGIALHETELTEGRDQLQDARVAYGRGEYAESRRRGTQAKNSMLAILDALGRHGNEGEGQFISVAGDVEYRRGDTGEWQLARSRLALAAGDYVRTGPAGSAEIMFGDGTLYTVKPSTSFIVTRPRGRSFGRPRGRDEQSITMEYGWVYLNTADNPTTVETPNAEALIDRESEGFVAFDPESREARYAAFRGSFEVQADGQTREIRALEQVVAAGGVLGEVERLPDRPELIEPADNLEVDLDKVDELTLRWEPVEGAARYALQVSRSHLFVDNVIDVADRAKTTATLGLRGDGNFVWQVAAADRDGSLGPWSAPHKFRVAASVDDDDGGDDQPPELDLEEVSAYGNIFIVGGRTEPGATVEINEEPVKVAADGTFIKTIQLNKEGWSFIEIRARDAWANETVRRRRVHVDVP